MSERIDSYRAKVYEQYNKSTYVARNDLSEAGLTAAADGYRRKLAPYLPEERTLPILEIGCGVGAFLACLQDLGYTDARGVDIAPDQVRFCRDRGFENVEVGDGLAYLEASRESFGAIVMSDVLEHLDKSTALATLEAARSRLHLDGRLILRVPNLSNPLNLRTRYVDFTHEIGFSKESLAQVLRVTGFEILTIHGDFSPHRRWLARWIFDRVLWSGFKLLYRHTLHLKSEIVRGKNLIAVATVSR